MARTTHKSPGTTSESRDVSEFFGKTTKRPEADTKPPRTPKDRNTGSKLANKLKGRVIG